MSDVPEVDVRVDLHSVDDTGYVWAFADRIQQPTAAVPGAVVIAGNRTLRSLAQVVDFADEPAGRVVHLRVLDGDVVAFAHQRKLARAS